jgi:murein DD-endopeptidase MepM/ murein hydrolase activator NlpD
MSKFSYYYNPDTCQYERAKLSPGDVVVYTIGLMLMSVACFAGFILLYNFLLQTDTEKRLRAENRAIRQYKPVLETKLSLIESTLTQLDEQDKVLYTRLFNTTPPSTPPKKSSFSQEAVLLADAVDFRKLLRDLDAKTTGLVDRAQHVNGVFGEDIHIGKDDADLLMVMPAIQPLEDATLDHFASGFGNRINPFHKGTYHHDGVDYAAPRGTVVVATGNGTVTAVKKSDLQAGYGNYVEISHGHGFITRYAHLEDITIKAGQKISKGTPIGTVGNSGGSVAPHLHYEVIRDGDHVDPVLYMVENLTSQAYSELKAKSKKQNQSLD